MKKIALAGYSGFIGNAITSSLHQVDWILLSREDLYGDVHRLSHLLEGAEVVINLAGSSIAKRWTRRNRRRIIESRFVVNSHIVEAINMLERKPSTFITASAIGYYDTNGIHSENEFSVGNNFLVQVVKQWELPLEQLDLSVQGVTARFGLVLGRKGGFLAPLLKVASFGILPIMGSGKQFYSFIHIDDLVKAMDFIVERKKGGVYNLCSPYPTDNATFTRTLAAHTGDPFIFRLPSFFLKMSLGASHIMVTQGQFVLPERMNREGFKFRYPHIADAIQNLVK